MNKTSYFSLVSFFLLFLSIFTVNSTEDFGDAPDSYGTLISSNGAGHLVNPAIFLGNLIDEESDGQPTINADGDDMNNDDEDGIIFLTQPTMGENTLIQIQASTNGYLNAWIDFDGSGSFLEPGKQIFTDQPIMAGINQLQIAIPSNSIAGNTYARFRFTTISGIGPVGQAQDGEVEDYKITIAFGDADGDGATSDIDCDDFDPTRFPNNLELCDAIDNNCNGLIDDGLTTQTTCGVGACISSGTQICTNGMWFDDLICIPQNPIQEILDNIDNNCDGVIDEGFEDTDGDGVIDTSDNCPTDLNPNQEDSNNSGVGDACDTAKPEIEISGNNNIIADDDSIPSTTDNTDFGTINIETQNSTKTFTIRNTGSETLLLTDIPTIQIQGINQDEFIMSQNPSSSIQSGGSTTFQIIYTPNTQGIHAATITINNNDYDENPYNFNIQGTGYKDSDNDGYSELGGDCNDNNSNINPDATELCDNTDNNCNGQTDDIEFNITYFLDQDQDTFGNSTQNQTILSCQTPLTYVTNNLDCNDNNITINPLVSEIFGNNIDENCDGITWSFIIGNLTKNTTKVKINGSENLTKEFNKTRQLVEIFDEGELLIEFYHNFNQSTPLDLNFTINNTAYDNKGAILINNLKLQENETKTIYLNKLNGNRICIIDSDLTSISQISSKCTNTANNEISLTCNGITTNGYTCTDLGTKYKIQGLTHSAIIEYTYSNTDGGNSNKDKDDKDDDNNDEPKNYCSESEYCSSWTSCSNGIQSRTCNTKTNDCTFKNTPETELTCDKNSGKILNVNGNDVSQTPNSTIQEIFKTTNTTNTQNLETQNLEIKSNSQIQKTPNTIFSGFIINDDNKNKQLLVLALIVLILLSLYLIKKSKK